MNGEDRNLLEKIYSHCVKIEILENDVKDIKAVINKPIFQRIIDDAELHIGDQESLMKKLGKCYGYNKKLSGWELLDKSFEKLAIELERKNSFVHSLLNATAFKVIESISLICIFIYILIQFLGG